MRSAAAAPAAVGAEASGKGSRAAALRGFVAERLSAASREILAVLDAAVAAYEEEASGFREQLRRQREQLPEHQLISKLSDAQYSKQRGSPEEEEGEDEETSEHAKSPDFPGPLSSSGERRRRKRRKRPGRPRVCRHDNSIDLSIRVLEDSSIQQLSKHVMEKSPVVPLRCPRTLQEEDFLNLLRSSVPQLSDKPFDLLTSDRRRRLRRRTPADIQRVFSCAGLRASTLYVRLKTQEDPLQLLQAPQTDVRLPAVHAVQEAGRHSRDEDEDEDEEESCRTESQQENMVEAGGGNEAAAGGPAADDEEEDDEDGRSQSAESEGQKTVIQVGLQDGHQTGISTESSPSAGSRGEHAAARPEETPPTSASADLELHECFLCQQRFQLDEELKAHSRTHAKSKTHMCGVCGKVLSNSRSLSRHKKTHSTERPHACRVCGRGFKLPTTLKQHEKIHTHRERSFLCDVCCKMFLTGKQLQVHMRTHTNEKPYRCDQCGRGFTTRGPLTVHMRVHTGETPYRCPYCGWSFKRKTHLDNHLAVHTGAKPFVCGICGKTCARKTYLTVHMRTHNGERPYKCGACGKGFTQSHSLKTHLKSH
uniref:C2H2-type domain-containing protein n=1 Tax=Oryzias latipes TaxID=8090 RepID=A0A3P9MR99_ORYLA